jgi:hypothetical protein
MTIRSTVSCKPCTPKALPFPKLMKHKDNGRIVLFTTEARGVVVLRGTGSYNIGELHTNWAPSYYEDYTGSVCLENEKA